MSHDRDTCPFCLNARVRWLHRGGLSTSLARQLILAGTAALPQIKVLETATPQQIAMLNAEAAQPTGDTTR